MLLQTLWERMGNTPAGGLHEIMLSEVRNFPELAQFYTDEVIVPPDELFCHCVQRGIDSGEFRVLPLHEVALALMAQMLFMAIHRHSLGACPVAGGVDVDPAAVLRTHPDMVVRGLQVRDAAPARARPRIRPLPARCTACLWRSSLSLASRSRPSRSAAMLAVPLPA